jgi:hypothetical protein
MGIRHIEVLAIWKKLSEPTNTVCRITSEEKFSKDFGFGAGGVFYV